MDNLEFLKYLAGTKTIQFSDLYSAFNYKTAMSMKKNMYFVAGLSKQQGTGVGGRAVDGDVTSKKYMLVDIDIRDSENKMSDDELDDKMGEVLGVFNEDNLLKEYSYCVASGNGMHFYFCGEENIFDSVDYKSGCLSIYEKINKKIENTGCKCDTKVSNISSLIRLPGSYNYSRKKKYGLEPKEVQIIVEQPQDSQFFNNIKKYAKERADAISKESKVEYKSKPGAGKNIYEMIGEIHCGEMFSEWSQNKMSGINFKSKNDGKNIGAFYSEKHNMIIYEGTKHLSGIRNGYSPRTLVKFEIEPGSTDEQIIDYFCRRYPQLEEYRPKEKEVSKAKVIDSSHSDNDYDDETYFTWGNLEVDKTFGMMSVGDLVIVASFTSQGKTLWCTQMAEKNGLDGHKVAYYTLEVNPQKLKKRQGMIAVGLSKYEYQKKMYTDEQKVIMDKARDNFDKHFKLSGFDSQPHINQIIEDIEEKYKKGYRLFYIDNLDKILTDDSKDLDRQFTVTGRLQALKNKLPICIVLVHHYNKPKEGDLGKTGGLHKIRGNNKIGDDSNILVEIRRDNDVISPSNQVRITQYKDTETGTIGQATLYFEGGKYFDDISYMRSLGNSTVPEIEVDFADWTGSD